MSLYATNFKILERCMLMLLSLIEISTRIKNTWAILSLKNMLNRDRQQKLIPNLIRFPPITKISPRLKAKKSRTQKCLNSNYSLIEVRKCISGKTGQTYSSKKKRNTEWKVEVAHITLRKIRVLTLRDRRLGFTEVHQ